jgi:hypothetical protein
MKNKPKKDKDNKDKTISFRLDPSMIDFLEDVAKDSNLSLSVLMRNICKQWIVFAKETSSYAKQPVTFTFDNKHKVEGILLFSVKDAPVISAYAGKVSINYTQPSNLQTK